MVRVPLGRTWATSAARVRLTLSERLIEPAPTFEVSDPIFTRLPGSMLLGRAFSRPKKLVRLASSELVRLVGVVLDILGASATETFTVMTSPTWVARGSWKKLLAPGCHSELPAWVMGGGVGMAATIWVSAGLPTGASFGARPIFSMRSTAEQPDRALPSSRRKKNLGKALRMRNPISGRRS